MPKIISGHIKNELPIHYEISIECKLEVLSFHMLPAWVKYRMVVDINIQGLFYVKKFYSMLRIPNAFKIQFLPVENIFFQLYI